MYSFKCYLNAVLKKKLTLTTPINKTAGILDINLITNKMADFLGLNLELLFSLNLGKNKMEF